MAPTRCRLRRRTRRLGPRSSSRWRSRSRTRRRYRKPVLATLSGNENTALSLSGLTVAEAPNADVLTTVLTVTNGTITAGGQTGATVTLSGTAAAINTALRARPIPGARTTTAPTRCRLRRRTDDWDLGLKPFAITVADTTTVSGKLTGDAERQREHGAVAEPGSRLRMRRTRRADDGADGYERHDHGRGSDWGDGDAERDGGGDQHGAGERELYRRSRLPWRRHAVGDDDGRRWELWASTFGDHGRGHDGGIGNLTGTLSGNENTALSLGGLTVADAPNATR